MAYSILIVDSQRERIRALQETLEDLHQRLILTGVMSGEEGLLEARLNPVDLVISRARLPGMDGAALLQRIRSVRPAVKTVLLTGGLEARRPAGAADAVFADPFDEGQFLQAVADLLALPPLPRTPGHAPAPSVADEEPQSLPDRLTALRHILQAEAVILISDTGQVLARAGTLPEQGIEPAVLPALMASFSAGARISRFLGPTMHPNLYFYRGEKIHLIMSAVGHSWALVGATRQELQENHTAAIRQAIPDIAAILAKLGVPMLTEEETQVPPFLTEAFDPMEEEVVPVTDTRLEALLKQPAEKLQDDADAFWEPGEDPVILEGLWTDALSYQQAIQLGLAPEDSDEE